MTTSDVVGAATAAVLTVIALGCVAVTVLEMWLSHRLARERLRWARADAPRAGCACELCVENVS